MRRNRKIRTLKNPDVSVRTLTNPAVRLPLRENFPDLLITLELMDGTGEALTRFLEAELQPLGMTLDTLEHLTIAYPQKHPGLFKDYRNSAKDTAELLGSLLNRYLPKLNVFIDGNICETRHLHRTANQSTLHALMSRQTYEVHMTKRRPTIPFLRQNFNSRECFMICDGVLEQGTTLANLSSFITHNGGYVLGAAVTSIIYNDESRRLRQKDSGTSKLSKPFNDAAKNKGRLPELANAFCDSNVMDGETYKSPERCLDMFEAALRPHGHSLYALTDNECCRLLETIRNELFTESYSFPDMLQKLSAAPQP